MLEGVGIDLATLERFVRLSVVVEGDRLDGQALFGSLRDDDAPDVLILAADDADLNSLLVLCEGRRRGGQSHKRDG